MHNVLLSSLADAAQAVMKGDDGKIFFLVHTVIEGSTDSIHLNVKFVNRERGIVSFRN